MRGLPPRSTRTDRRFSSTTLCRSNVMKEVGNLPVGWIATCGPWGLLLVSLGDSAFVPLPQGVDALLITQVIAAPSTAWLAASMAVFGSVAGSLILYGA